jgi:hypothetical protein
MKSTSHPRCNLSDYGAGVFVLRHEIAGRGISYKDSKKLVAEYLSIYAKKRPQKHTI